MDVSILSPDTIKITVYEKALAGYVAYMDSFMYFDKDGYVVESSKIKTEGVPQITGLQFASCTLGQKLPVEQEGIFSSIMDLTKLLSKYELLPDRIYFRDYTEITLYFADVRVALGTGNNLEEKLTVLPTFLQGLEGQRGFYGWKIMTEIPKQQYLRQTRQKSQGKKTFFSKKCVD